MFHLFFQKIGTSEHPTAAAKLSLGATVTYVWSAIDLWRSQGRFIGLHEENENLQKKMFFLKKIIFLNDFYFLKNKKAGPSV